MLIVNRYLHDTMDQTICGWVERGERLLVLAQDGKGEVYMQGNIQVVQGLEEDQEMFKPCRNLPACCPAIWPVFSAQNTELLFQPSGRMSQTFQ